MPETAAAAALLRLMSNYCFLCKDFFCSFKTHMAWNVLFSTATGMWTRRTREHTPMPRRNIFPRIYICRVKFWAPHTMMHNHIFFCHFFITLSVTLCDSLSPKPIYPHLSVTQSSYLVLLCNLHMRTSTQHVFPFVWETAKVYAFVYLVWSPGIKMLFPLDTQQGTVQKP